MTITTPEEYEGMREAGRLVAQVLREMLGSVESGMTTADLDTIGADAIRHRGGESAPKVTYGFPGATCISINEEMAHGIPGERVIQRGDVVNIDVSAKLDGFYSDCAATTMIEEGEEQVRRLIHAARLARDKAIVRIRPGVLLNVVGRVFEEQAHSQGFRVVRNLCSHGIGTALHEDPAEILGVYDRFEHRRFHDGLVLTIEPFLSTKSVWAGQGDDGWTLLNDEGGRSAQFEHTILVRRGEAPEILTSP